MTVNHSENFVNPYNGCHTQKIERLWRELKNINKRYQGILRCEVKTHLAEFIFKKNELKNGDPFMKTIELISQIKFGGNDEIL